ncbi:hypothetical protein LZK73_01445 [Neorhizobium galegae]|nr:hypothetical protein LZK73_01445 [Neorhizobium galegae]
MPALRELIGGDAVLPDEAVVTHPKVRAAIAERLREHQKQSSGSATRVMRMMLMTQPLRFERAK